MFGKELKRLRELRNLSQAELARRLNMSSSAIAMYESGRREPKNYETLELIADFFNVNLEMLISGEKHPNLIPILGEIAAGIPIEAVENVIGYEEITDEMSKKGEYFALKIQGKSMEPRILENDIVIVKKQNFAETGDLVIVLINGDSATCKKLIKYKDGIALQSFNSSFEPMYFNATDIISMPVEILGKVIELRAKF